MTSTSSFPVIVSNLATSTTQSTLEHFFSFCGKIESIERVDPGTSATIHFAKLSATKTALLLNGASLDGSTIEVSSTEGETVGLAGQSLPLTEEEEIEQEEKPKSAIMSEYLAHGYLLSDLAVQKAIESDQKYGISTRFLSIFNPLAAKAQPTVDATLARAKQIDAEQGLSLKALAASTVGRHYYTSALKSALGARVHAFYTSTSKQLADVHEEALRIKESKKSQANPNIAAQSVAEAIPTEKSSDVKA